MSSITIKTTKNYGLFHYTDMNRDVKPRQHEALHYSLKQNGSLPWFPVVCVRNTKKQLIIHDGQHRVFFCQKLQLPVHYVVADEGFDIAVINSSSKSWTALDYAEKYAKEGNEHYLYGIEFSDKYQMPTARAFGILAGCSYLRDAKSSFRNGKFEVKDKEAANMIASTYMAMVSISRTLKTARFLEALAVVCRVKEFEPARFLKKAMLQQDKLGSYSTREAYVDMIESVYNYRAQKLVPLAILARQIMKNK